MLFIYWEWMCWNILCWLTGCSISTVLFFIPRACIYDAFCINKNSSRPAANLCCLPTYGFPLTAWFPNSSTTPMYYFFKTFFSWWLATRSTCVCPIWKLWDVPTSDRDLVCSRLWIQYDIWHHSRIICW